MSMTTRGWVAAGLAAAVMTQIAPAGAQQNPTVQAQTGVDAQGRPGAEGRIDLANPPPADQPLVKKLPEPRLFVEGGAGILGYVGGTAGLGPAWNLRVAGRFGDRYEVEGNYTGGANQRSDGAGSLLYTAVDGDFRFNILNPRTAPITPFVAGGLGFASYAGKGGSPIAFTVPIYAGADRMLTRNIKVGARFNFRPAFGEDLGQAGQTNSPGGDTWSLVANLGGAF
jgi:hypothetical protein